MRYLIESVDDEMDVGRQLSKLVEIGKIKMIEKTDPLENMKENLHKIQRSMDILNKAGIDKDVIKAYIQAKTHLSQRDINTCLASQDEFFRKLGVSLK